VHAGHGGEGGLSLRRLVNGGGGGAVAFRQRGGSGEPRGSLAAAMGNGKVRVRPQFGQSASLLE
jgi:hypothetical protein